MPEEPRLEEQALSQAVEMGLSSQMHNVETIAVDVRTNLLKLILGKADSISLAGSGLTMQKDIRVQEMQMHADKVAINPLSAVLGQIELNQPVDTTVRVVLTEEDINRALNSDYIKAKLIPLELCVDGQIVTIELQLPLLLHLPGDGKIEFSGAIVLHETGKTRQVGFTAGFLSRTHEYPVRLEEFRCTPGVGGISLQLTLAIMHKLTEIVNLPYFDLEGMAVRIQELSVQKASLTLIAEAHVYQLPSP